ncbi:GntR family transcriptional regulator [Brachybacterium sp. MASK1Z-5]|uniref:GntR family transcriptional regulator n=1 Tax=Brachybacterium halotolerans TaxID=2795215 RepID=A0ABS1B9S2_9MICO|nr:GntR family transcriptional regulator [Brachybacterium halotolerans]MBK0331404.1 GntR family transcriptional regulator [Brachybacterium halotolerans]
MATRNDRESVFTTLRSEILEGELAPGAPLRETALASRFEVSRTPVRDALSRLEQAGLAVRAARGLAVRGVDPQVILQAHDARIPLEEQIAGDAAVHRTVQDVLRLEALLDRDRALEDYDPAELARRDLAAHRALWTAAQNPVLSELLEALAVHLAPGASALLEVQGRWEDSLASRTEMLRAIGDRDAAAARAIARSRHEADREARLQLLREATIAEAARTEDEPRT